MTNWMKQKKPVVTLVSLLVISFCVLMFGMMAENLMNKGASGFVSVSAEEVKVTTANLNLRSGPGTEYSIVTVMPQGSEVTVTGYSGNWAKVNYGNYSGYASTYYLTDKGGTTVAYATANLNLRTGPGTSYAIILTIPKGSSVSVISTSGGWSKVTYNGKTGYASATYLSSSAPSTVLSYKYTTAALNLRTGPGTSYAVILTIPKGARVEVLDTSLAWPKIRYSGKVGYASPSYLSNSPPTTTSSGAPAVAISKGNKSSTVKKIAITFDDYGSVSQIRSILDTLDAYGAKSTFFPNGDWIKNNPTIVKEIAARGHVIESHGYSHPEFTDVSEAEIRRQITLDRDIIRSTVGTTSYLLRPPYGSYDERVKRIAGEEGYKYLVLWSVDTSDWATTRDGVTITPTYIVNHTLENATHNGIVLMHMHSDKTVTALPTLLRELKARGYNLVTVNDIVN